MVSLLRMELQVTRSESAGKILQPLRVFLLELSWLLRLPWSRIPSLKPFLETEPAVMWRLYRGMGMPAFPDLVLAERQSFFLFHPEQVRWVQPLLSWVIILISARTAISFILVR